MTLKLNGEKLDLRPLPPTIQKVIATLEKCPKDELYTAERLADLARVGLGSLHEAGFQRRKELQPYTERIGRVRYWGHKLAITQLRKEAGL